jgi:hypothetical protein
MAFKKGITLLPGYPQQVGEKTQVIFDRTGPSSYTQYTISTGVGGDVLYANSGSGLNYSGFDRVLVNAIDTTGQIQAQIIMFNAGYGNALPKIAIRYMSLVTATVGGQSQTAGSEAVAGSDFSALSWRFEAWMV